MMNYYITYIRFNYKRFSYHLNNITFPVRAYCEYHQYYLISSLISVLFNEERKLGVVRQI